MNPRKGNKPRMDADKHGSAERKSIHLLGEWPEGWKLSEIRVYPCLSVVELRFLR
jgi:hypothetical protein